MIEVHKIGVHLAMTSNHAEVLQALSRDLLGIHPKLEDLKKNIGTIGPALGGAFAIITGGLIIKGLIDIIDKTKELSREMSQIEKMGINAADRQRMQQEAIAVVGRHPGLTQSDVVDIGSRAYSRTGGDVPESIRQMDILAQAEKLIAANRGDYTPNSADSGSIFRAAENLGRATTGGNFDAKKFGEFVQRVVATDTITHHAIGPRDWEALGKRGGLAMSGMSDRGLVEAAIAGQYMNPSMVGTAEQSMYQQWVGDTMTGKTAGALIDYGFINKQDVIGQHGSKIDGITDAGQAKLRATLGNSPVEAATNIMNKLNSDGITDPQKQQEILFKILSRSTSQRLMGEIMRARGQIGKEADLIMGAPHPDQMEKIGDEKDIGQNIHNLSAAWQELINTIGGPNNENFIAALKALTGAINDIKKSVQGMDPERIKQAGIAIASFGGAAVVAGIAAIIAAAGPLGVLVVSAGALAAALSPLAKTFDDIEKAVQGFGEKLRSYFSWMMPGGSGSKGGSTGNDLYNAFPQISPMSYTPGGGASNPVMLTLTGPVAIAINGQLMGGGGGGFSDGFGGGGGGGGGITNASFSPGGGGGGNPLGGASSAGGFRAITGGGTIGTGRALAGVGGGGGGGWGADSGGPGVAADLMHGQFGGVGQNLVDVSAGGQNFKVNAAAAPAFKGFVDELASAGAPIGSIGGARNTRIAGTNKISQHAYGNALDINQLRRNVVTPAFRQWANANPGALRNAMHHWGVISGGDWHNPDFGHFEWGGTHPGALSAAARDPNAAAISGGMVGGGAAGGIDRSQFASQLSPQLVGRMASMIKGEVGLGPRGDTNKQIIQLESMFNRNQVRNQRLGADLFHGRGGYYASTSFPSVSQGEVEWFNNNVLGPVMRGSDLGSQFLGKPVTGNASQMGFAGRRLSQGLYERGRWWGDHPGHDEMFVVERDDARRMGQHPLPRLPEDEHVGGLRAFMGKKRWHGKKSIPDAEDRPLTVHSNLHVDGRRMAGNVMKHVNRSMNTASQGSRMPDYSAARPMPV
jgi:hypothetical protein